MASEKRLMLVFSENGDIGLNMDDGIPLGMIALAVVILQKHAFSMMEAQARAATQVAQQKPTGIVRAATLPQNLKKVQ